MGAPGYALFCDKGHLFDWTEEHLDWDEKMLEEHRGKEKEGCPCGEEKVIQVTHYGGLNDCICLQENIPQKGITPLGREAIIPILIKEAFDKEGKPIEAFCWFYLPLYHIPTGVRDGSVYKEE
ncbi:hypothetical protein LCGC14_1928240 [marine sediment metagenome]|uniref:Uncharacterized protein n=1 Tax=marine sediment metagenome TaxID=412755 RepID=A0A0F9FPA2_9ZZZZ